MHGLLGMGPRLNADMRAVDCSLMSEHLHTKRRDRAGSVLSTSLLLGTAIGSAQSLILLVSPSGCNKAVLQRRPRSDAQGSHWLKHWQ